MLWKPMTKPLFLAQVVTYKSKAYYAGVQDWTQMTTANKHLSVAISANMLSSLPCAVSSMFLNNTRFNSDGIAVLLSFITHLNHSSNKNPSRNIRPHSPRNRSGGKQHVFHVPRLQRIPTSKRVFDRLNNPPILYHNPVPWPLSRREEQVPSWWSSTGQLWPPSN